jgi:hypothetical protein
LNHPSSSVFRLGITIISPTPEYDSATGLSTPPGVENNIWQKILQGYHTSSSVFKFDFIVIALESSLVFIRDSSLLGIFRFLPMADKKIILGASLIFFTL